MESPGLNKVIGEFYEVNSKNLNCHFIPHQ